MSKTQFPPTPPAAAPGCAPLGDEITAFTALPWGRRFDVRIATLFGCGTLIILIAAGVFAYQAIVDATMQSFSKRLESLALTLSQTVEADRIPSLNRREDKGAA